MVGRVGSSLVLSLLICGIFRGRRGDRGFLCILIMFVRSHPHYKIIMSIEALSSNICFYCPLSLSRRQSPSVVAWLPHLISTVSPFLLVPCPTSVFKRTRILTNHGRTHLTMAELALVIVRWQSTNYIQTLREQSGHALDTYYAGPQSQRSIHFGS
jgi:hypothetical protein